MPLPPVGIDSWRRWSTDRWAEAQQRVLAGITDLPWSITAQRQIDRLTDGLTPPPPPEPVYVPPPPPPPPPLPEPEPVFEPPRLHHCRRPYRRSAPGSGRPSAGSGDALRGP